MAFPFERPLCPNITKLSRNLIFWISELPKSSIRCLLSCERLPAKTLKANFHLFMHHFGAAAHSIQHSVRKNGKRWGKIKLKQDQNIHFLKPMTTDLSLAKAECLHA